jgi:hypothetical protein
MKMLLYKTAKRSLFTAGQSADSERYPVGPLYSSEITNYYLHLHPPHRTLLASKNKEGL